MSFEIEVQGGSSVRLPTAGKYCDRDIIVTATGGGADGAYDEGYTAGQQAEYDRFWDAYQQNGNRTNYGLGGGGFHGDGWTDDNFNPKYPICPIDASYLFRATGISDLTKDGVVLDFSNATNFNYAFGYLTHPIELPTIDMSSAKNCTSTFSNLKNESLSLIFSENTTPTNNMFDDASNLMNLTISGTIAKAINLQWQSKLTNESVQGIINNLKDLTGATAQTLTLHATVGANLTEAQKATVTAKNWTLVY